MKNQEANGLLSEYGIRTPVNDIPLTLFSMGFFGAAHGWGGAGVAKKSPLENLSHITYNDETRHSYTLYLI